ncbi:PREDICTED: exocyst complex component EXO70B1 [Tarenaya hassleriana]|uniref:exocyst complex component EXO70B1 n=1 Tax=Tarenaya hassleriana TaxID=28532 RepID=UPI00053C26E8|nr:PREDICTED: exocyst complex component EXO70B1 [Tarenaya hassleriana]XP_010536630.1 PREDICTED: exocyst complex component EXO70B1 [Tarenaya hassleriana]XP_010536631.1 PREDICTED: exocyst complex component EXO70B1 [Tarenaya hassleriana]
MAATTTTATDASSIGSAAPGGGGGPEDRVLATAQQIVKSLNTPKEVREDMLLIFSSFDNRLSNIKSVMTKEEKDESDVALARLEAAEMLIHRWDSGANDSSRHSSSSSGNHHHNSSLSVSFEESSEEAVEFLSAVDEILSLLEGFSLENKPELVERADSSLQLAMSQLEDEFRHILIRNTVPLDAERLYGSIRRTALSFADGDIGEEFENFGEVADGEEIGSRRGLFHERGGSIGGDLWVDLINPIAVAGLKEIAERMIRSGYEKECVQVYSTVRRDALDECLMILGVEKLSIEEVQKIEWKVLDEKMKKWIQAVKITVKVLLAGEKRLCDEIFSSSESSKEICFNETTKGCVMQLLNFGEAVAIGRRSSEKLFRILDMYDALANVLQALQVTVTDEFLCNEARVVLAALADAVRGTFVAFENNVLYETSKRPTINGEVHPMIRYVMNYVKLIVDYAETLNSLLENDEDNELEGISGDDANNLPENMSPLAKRLLRLITSLELNLEEKSKLYEDGGLQCIFLMNNILYIVQKVKDSELGKLLGDDWVKKRRGQIRQYATGYLRASWSRVLSSLREESGSSSNSPSYRLRSSSSSNALALKERFKAFNASFEELYRVQTAWKVPDPQLREELRISISEKVIPAYRAFFGRNKSQLEGGRHAGKYIKYTPDDLEGYLLDLFEGSQTVIHHPRRKSS